MNNIAEDILMHYGVGAMDGAPGRGSGRYPLGSGETPFQHGSGGFLGRYRELQDKGLSEKEIATEMSILDENGRPSTGRLRVQVQLAKHEERSALVATAKRMRDEGNSLDAIAKAMGYKNDSSVRALLDEDTERRKNQAQVTADYLKEIVDQKGMVDVGAGVAEELGITSTKLAEALYILELEGYNVYKGGIPQITNKGQQTNQRVLCTPDKEHKDIYQFDQVYPVTDYDYILTDDGTKKRKAFVYPESMDSSRLKIRYAEEGGVDKDGVIELRRGVDDLSLGDAAYSQVRILVDGTHYLKGMAVYSDGKDMPDGVDVIFNTNKKKGTPALGDDKNNTVLKKIKQDPNNPFGSNIKERGGQSYYIGEDGKEHLSLINKRSDEGDWSEWKDVLPSQFLAKQNLSLINRQLKMAKDNAKLEFDEIMSVTNPTVRIKLLNDFAENCDSAAVHLQAAALPRQRYQVILPLTTIKDNEVYAPNYDNGETVALVRFPHAGTFEIPILKVNNRNAEGKRVITNLASDAIGINSKVAAQLSGADFDGDTVMVIPTGKNGVKITSSPPLKGLANFDPKLEYGGKPEGTYKRMTKNETQKQMGIISNLITDMQLKGASPDELARAVRHSMVVIDAEKHGLDYLQSEKDNRIDDLKRTYQPKGPGKKPGGASTLLSRAKSPVYVDKRQGQPKVDPDTGELIYKTSDNLYFQKRIENKKTGEVTYKTEKHTQKSTQMAETRDAHTLSTGTPKENAYANYANEMKAFANQARKEALSTREIEYSKEANKKYKSEVRSLESKVKLALLNKPREREAQRRANYEVSEKIRNNPELKDDKGELKKASQQALNRARGDVGAGKDYVSITPNEWEAIQAGAISKSMLRLILDNADMDSIRQMATPRPKGALSNGQVARIKALSDAGYTTSQIARTIGCSVSTVQEHLKTE